MRVWHNFPVPMAHYIWKQPTQIGLGGPIGHLPRLGTSLALYAHLSIVKVVLWYQQGWIGWLGRGLTSCEHARGYMRCPCKWVANIWWVYYTCSITTGLDMSKVGGRGVHLICGKWTLELILKADSGGHLICKTALYASIYGNLLTSLVPKLHKIISKGKHMWNMFVETEFWVLVEVSSDVTIHHHVIHISKDTS